MSEIPWSTILDAATAAAAFLPPPANVVADIALVIARAAIGRGCTIGQCPADVEEALEPADLPTGEAGLNARDRAIARGSGLDARGIADRRGDNDDPYASDR